MTATPAPLGWRFGQTFEAAEAARNNLTVLRFVAAFAVLFAHCWPIALGMEAADPLTTQLRAWFGDGVALAAMAVNAFFVISGYLVTKSALGRGVAGYAVARVLRIYPAIIVNVLLSALVVGLVATSLPLSGYFAAEQLWKFVGNNVLLWNVIYQLPGAFEGNPLAAVNGSLWTLPLEIRCYIAIGLFLALGVLRRAWLFSAIAAAIILVDGLFREAALLGSDAAAACFASFLLGALFYANRRLLPASIIPGAALAALAAFMPTENVARLLALAGFAWLVLWFGLAAPRLPWLERAIGDPSYGVYIYAFPIQQLVVFFLGAGSPWLLFAVSAPLTLIAGLASWKLIEAPMLARKEYAARGLASLFKFKRADAAPIQPTGT